ncbi:hypothetical protein RCO48_03035 [Peribacillus frigoritolerans]|nr:hypothetical protein [Peribacillus frigoritolerans]
MYGAYKKHLFKRSTFMIDKRLLSKRFSEHAQTYDAYANVQKKHGKAISGFASSKKTPIIKSIFLKSAAAPVT